MSRRRRLSRIVFGGLIKRQRTNYPNGGENNWRSTEIGNRTTVGGIHTSTRPTFGLFWRTADGRKNKQKAWICFALAAVEGWRQPRRYTRGVQCDRQPKSLTKIANEFGASRKSLENHRHCLDRWARERSSIFVCDDRWHNSPSSECSLATICWFGHGAWECNSLNESLFCRWSEGASTSESATVATFHKSLHNASPVA